MIYLFQNCTDGRSIISPEIVPKSSCTVFEYNTGMNTGTGKSNSFIRVAVQYSTEWYMLVTLGYLTSPYHIHPPKVA